MAEDQKSVSVCESCMQNDQSIFRILNAIDPDLVQGIEHGISFQSETDLLTQGAQVKGVYSIISGRVKISRTSGSGKEQIIRFAKKGDVLGFRTLMSNHSLGVSATTIEDCMACFIERDEFLRVLRHAPQLRKKLLEELSEDLAEMVDALTSMAHRSVRSRLCGALLILEELYDGQGINLSRENLANFVGTANESVIRLLSEMKNEQLIEIQGRKITILDRQRIKNIEQFS